MNILRKSMEEIVFLFFLAQKEQEVKITASFKLFDADTFMLLVV